jgi:hypothetical protein
MIRDPFLNSSALDTVFHFVPETHDWTPAIAMALEERLEPGRTHSGHSRIYALPPS